MSTHATDAPSAAPQGTLTPFVFERAAIRGGVALLGAASRAILAAHAYPPAVARAEGELLAAATLLASTLKLDGSLVAQLRGDGPLTLLVVECTGDLDLRATAQWREAEVAALGPAASLAELAGGPSAARLAITLDPRGGTMYQGIVSLAGTSIAESIEHYLATSEQLASRLVLHLQDGDARGLLLQRLPASTASDDAVWQRALARLADAPAALRAASDAVALLRMLFAQDDVRVFPARATRFRCRCSRARAGNALRIAGRAEVDAALAAEGRVDVTCEYCGQRYVFDRAEALALFAPPDGRPH